MGAIYKKIIKPILFNQDPEKAHDLALFSLKLLGKCTPIIRLMERYNRTDGRPIKLFGVTFPNRVGLAAGFDKNAECIRAAAALGFGHIEVGTITYHRQPGNPKPRLFRFPEQGAILNRLGFNNDGAEAIANHLSNEIPKAHKSDIPIGINIGKSKATPVEEAAKDYISSFNLLADYADYITINISSPNTQGLRSLQSKQHLPELLQALQNENENRAKKMGSTKTPLILKIAPDLSFRGIDFILESATQYNISGIIATNTTLKRPGFFSKVDEPGGLSGPPLHPYSIKVINYISRATEGKLPIIGSGGVMSPESAGRMYDAGASLIQIYTGLIYEGPFLGRTIARSLAWTQNDWI